MKHKKMRKKLFGKTFRTFFKLFTLVFFAIGLGFVSVFAALGAAGASYIAYLNSTLPSYEELISRDVPESSKVYSRDGTLLYEFHGEYKRTSIKLEQIPPYLKNATLAIEDKDFYKHGAVSLSGIGRALMANFKSKGVVQGGSTITQQFVKNALLKDRSRSYSRKVKEILLAYKMERHFTKDEIFELYLNEIPYGRNAYGAEAASQAYFGKSAAQLNLAESAYLAALPQAPSRYSPTSARDELDARRNLVLKEMQSQGYATELDINQAQNAEVAFRDPKTQIIAPYFVASVQNYLISRYGSQFLKEGGLKVYTTLDLKLQALAEQVVKEGAEVNAKKYRAYNAALVAVEPSSGKILAMVGGKDFWGAPEPKGCTIGANCKFEPQVNVATSQRQPGSSFKPYAYVTAFKPEFGFTPLSNILDAPTVFGYSGGKPYAPKNYDGSYRGIVSMRKALAGSLNVPAVKTVQAVGVANVVKTAKSLGVTSGMENCGLSLVLGGCEIKLVDHTSAFAVLANGGKGSGGTPFLKIEDKNGKILESYKEPTDQAVNPEAAYELISVMSDNAAREYIFGKDSPLVLKDRVVAAKTGTTQNWKDGWTVGFTPQLAVGVWTGNNDSSLMRAGSDGVFTAAPIWNRFMTEALKDQPAVDFTIPPGIIQIAYDPASNRPAAAGAKNVRMEPFPWYAVPREMQISAAPKWIKNLLIPADKEVKAQPNNRAESRLNQSSGDGLNKSGEISFSNLGVPSNNVAKPTPFFNADLGGAPQAEPSVDNRAEPTPLPGIFENSAQPAPTIVQSIPLPSAQQILRPSQ